MNLCTSFVKDIIKNNVLSKFKDLDDLIARVGEIGYLPEGAIACKYVHEISAKMNLKLVICDGLYKILNREVEPEEFLRDLLRLKKRVKR